MGERTTTTEREIDFDRLPLAARKRLVACASGRAEPRPLATALESRSIAADVIVVASGVAVVALVGLRGFGEGPQGARAAALYTVGALLVAAGVLGALATRAAARALPLARGRYLFPLALVDARAPRLRVVWLEPGTEVGVRRAGDGAELEVAGESFLGELAALEAAAAAIDQALAGAATPDLDPLFEARDATPARAPSGDGPLGRPTPALLRPAARSVLAVALAVATGGALFVGRERLSDDAAFERARRDGTVAALEAYAKRGGRHGGEIDALVAAARAADAEHAAATRRARSAAALAAFRGRANADDPRLVPVIERLLATLERRGDARVPLSFRPPTRAVLDAVDQILAERAGSGPPIAKVAPHFDAARTTAYEPDAARAIAAAFAEVFPADVLRIEPGDASDDQPSISVGYLVGWGGDAVVDTQGNRRFVSVVVDFSVTLDVPGEAALVLKFRVLPPDDLEVKVDADAATATEDQVYAAMATHAFRAVGAHVRSALYRK